MRMPTFPTRKRRRPYGGSGPGGAGNLPQDSVANVTQLFTIDQGELTDRIGRLGRDLVADIVRGIDLVLDPRRTLDGGTAVP